MAGRLLAVPTVAGTVVRMRRRVVLVVLACAVLLTGALAAWALRPAATPTVSTSVELTVGQYQEPFEACIAKGGDQASSCVIDLLATARANGEFGSALAMLRGGNDRVEDMVGRCHNQAHLVGEDIVKAGMPLLEAYKVAFSDCRFGFYHGALKQYTSEWDIDTLSRHLTELCAPFGGAELDATQECVHVTGHFIVDRIGTQLERSLDVCKLYSDTRLQSRCADGVLMEAVELVRPGAADPSDPSAERIRQTWGATRPEQQQTMVDLCDKQTVGEVRYVCYTSVSQTLAVLWQGDFTAVGEVCASLPQDGVQPCFEGVAGAAFPLFSWDPGKVAQACHAVDSAATRYCMFSMAMTFGMQDVMERAQRVCEFALPHEVQSCRDGLQRGASIRGSLQQTTSGQ